MIRPLAAALITAGALTLTACSSGASTTSTPSATAKREVAASPTTPAKPAADFCRDVKGDGDGFDIRRVELARVGDVERVTLTVSRAPNFAAQDSAAVVLSFYDPSGNHGGIFTTKWLPGETSTSVFDLDTTENTYVDDLSSVSGKTITLAYPAELVDRAGEGWVWTVATTLDGADVDACSISAYDAVIGA